jgi:hypothetical protein
VTKSISTKSKSLAGRIGALRMHALNDTRVVSSPGRDVAATRLNERLLQEIDPNQELPQAERLRRLEYARKAHFAKLALKSAVSRRRKAGSIAPATMRPRTGEDVATGQDATGIEALALPVEAVPVELRPRPRARRRAAA